MNGRVLATPAARQAASRMRALLAGDLDQGLQEVLRAVDVLEDPQLWDGPDALTFREARWAQVRASVTRAVRTLREVSEHAERVIADILQAGAGGGGSALAPNPAPAGTRPVAGPTPAAAGTPPLDQKTKDMLAYFRQHINDQDVFGPDGSLESIDQRLAQLSPAERAAFLSQLSPAEVRNWDYRIKGDPGRPGLGTSDRIQLANLLFGSADPATLPVVEANMPSLQPPLRDKDYGTGVTYQSTSGQPLFDPSTNAPVVPTVPPGQNEPTDIRQGNIGDCWFMSGLGEVARQNPGLIERNIQANPNGTYTVTLYQNGHPVPVVVTDDVPANGSGAIFAQSGSEADSSPKWAQLYEKAYAQLNGGYSALDPPFGSDGNVAMSAITGQPSQTENLNPWFGSGPSLNDLQSKLDSGQAITACTDYGWWGQDREDGGQLVSAHVYMVQSIDTSANPPTITVVNPWGNNAGAPQSVQLTESQFHQYFTDVCETPVGQPGVDPIGNGPYA